MKTKRMTIVALCAAPTIFSATIAVQLTGDEWATATNNLGNSGSVMDATNIEPGTGYNGPGLLGGAVASGGAGIDNWHVSNNGGANVIANLDVFRLQVASVPSAGVKFHHAVLFFDQSIFANGLDSVSGGVTLDDTTSLSYTAKRVGGNPSRIGYVLRADGDYFLHHIAYNDNQAGGGQGHVFSLADPTGVTWNNFDPTTSFSTIGAAATPDFTKVTGMGLWFENERADGNTSAMDFRVGEITFTAIPEPSSLALIGMALGALAFFRRRR